MNDFTAVAHAVSKLSPQDTRVIHTGKSGASGLKIVLGAGTGLGVAALTRLMGKRMLSTVRPDTHVFRRPANWSVSCWRF